MMKSSSCLQGEVSILYEVRLKLKVQEVQVIGWKIEILEELMTLPKSLDLIKNLYQSGEEEGEIGEIREVLYGNESLAK